MPVVTIDRRVPSVTDIIGHVGADNVKGGEAQGNLIVKMFPNGATIVNLQGSARREPGDRSQQGPAQCARQGRPQLQDRVRSRPPSSTAPRAFQSPNPLLAGMSAPPQVINAANDDMALGAIEALKARNLKGIVIIGFDALPEALGKVRDGEITATIEQFPAQAERDRRRYHGRVHQERQKAGAADHAC